MLPEHKNSIMSNDKNRLLCGFAMNKRVGNVIEAELWGLFRV